jgi:hypothetical protein
MVHVIGTLRPVSKKYPADTATMNAPPIGLAASVIFQAESC